MSSTQRSNSPVPSSGSSAGSVTPPSPTSASRKEGSLEEKERRLAEERALAALRLQRKQRLDALVRKRKTNLKYLQVKQNISSLTSVFRNPIIPPYVAHLHLRCD